MNGTLAHRAAGDVLAEIQRRQASGILRLQKDATTRQIFIDAGVMIRFAVSTLPNESITALFRDKGGVTEEQVRQATTTKQPQELLGTTLVRLGSLSRETLADLTREHIHRVVVGALAMRDGAYEFQARALPFREQLDGGLEVPEILLEWARALPDIDSIRKRFGSLEARVTLSTRPPEGYHKVPLNPAEGYIMSRVDGRTSVGEICMVSPMGEETTLRALFGLALAGILEMPHDTATDPVRPTAPAARAAPVRPAPDARRSPPDTHETLARPAGVLSTATGNDIRHAYYGLAKKFHPDKFTREDLKAKAEKVFAHITEAYSTLTNTEGRRKYDEDQALRKSGHSQEKKVDSGDMARMSFRHGKDMFDKGKFGEAISFLQNACDQDPSKAEHFHYLAMAQSRNPRWKRDAEEYFLRALEHDPTNAEIYAHLGSLYAKGGLHSKARDMFKKALQWDPANEEAQEGLAQGDDARKGILGMFKK